MKNLNYSVLMSIYHKEKPEFFKESIESMLKQSVKTNDFVIVCDGPLTKELDDIIKNFVKKNKNVFNIVRLEKNMGLGLALNKGILACKNEYIARMDTDDIAASNRIEKQLEFLINHKDIDMIGCSALEFQDNIDNIIDKAVFPLTDDEIKKYAKSRNPFCHPSVMFKKSKVIEAGNYESFHLVEDFDLWVRMILNGCKFANLSESYLYWRVGQDFYKRRSGLKYAKSILRFLKKQYKRGFLNRKEYYKACIIRTIVYLMPNKLRELIYKNVLRKKVN